MSDKDNAESIPHGTLRGYNHFKCRCDVCRALINQNAQGRRKANPEKEKEYRRRAYLKNRSHELRTTWCPLL